MNFGPTAPIDFDAIKKRNVETTIDFVKLMFRPNGEMPDPAVAESFMKNVVTTLQDTSALIGEVGKLREQRQRARDIHSPANSSDPAAPGAICTGCSLYGARVAWPCPTWNATEDPQPTAFGGLL